MDTWTRDPWERVSPGPVSCVGRSTDVIKTVPSDMNYLVRNHRRTTGVEWRAPANNRAWKSPDQRPDNGNRR